MVTALASASLPVPGAWSVRPPCFSGLLKEEVKAEQEIEEKGAIKTYMGEFLADPNVVEALSTTDGVTMAQKELHVAAATRAASPSIEKLQ